MIKYLKTLFGKKSREKEFVQVNDLNRQYSKQEIVRLIKLGEIDFVEGLDFIDLSDTDLSDTNIYKPFIDKFKRLNSDKLNSKSNYKIVEDHVFLRAHLKEANFENSNLQNCSFFYFDFYRSNFYNANLENVDLKNSGFYCSNLRRANLRRANLEGSHFYESYLNDSKNIPTSIRKAESVRFMKINKFTTFENPEDKQWCLDNGAVLV